jgi:hypothetical protein
MAQRNRAGPGRAVSGRHESPLPATRRVPQLADQAGPARAIRGGEPGKVRRSIARCASASSDVPARSAAPAFASSPAARSRWSLIPGAFRPERSRHRFGAHGGSAPDPRRWLHHHVCERCRNREPQCREVPRHLDQAEREAVGGGFLQVPGSLSRSWRPGQATAAGHDPRMRSRSSADSAARRPRSGIQISRFGTTPAGHLGDQIVDHIGGSRSR